MEKKQGEFLKKLLEDFKVEAAEHYQTIVNGLIELEKKPPDEKRHEIMEAVFREAHSLKGAARAVNLGQVERLCQHMETVFAGLKKKELELSSELFDALHTALDMLNILLTGQGTAESEDLTAVIHVLENIAKGGRPDPSRVMPRIAESIPTGDTVRISTVKLGALLLQVEELITVKLGGREVSDKLRGLQSRLAAWKKTWDDAVHPPGAPGTAGAPALTEELLRQQDDFFSSLDHDLGSLTRRMDQDNRAFARSIDGLVDDMKKALMFPFSSALEVLPKLVRDLAHDGGKEAELVINGGEIEMDRRILEEMKDPLVHLVRNCMDYGIETPEIRAAKNKPTRGTVMITISQKESRRAEIIVTDDGAGIDTAKVRTAAIKVNAVTPEAADKLTESELVNLIFHSGISTSSIITDISGRGLGLAIVQEKVEKLGGSISVETAPNAGTTFRMVLPLILATFRGVAVIAGGMTFVIPLKNVDRVIRVQPGDIKTIESRDTIELKGQVIGLVWLRDALGLPALKAPGHAGEFVPVLVLSYTRKRMAFIVDEVIGEQEGLIKGLGSQLVHVRNITGATVSGGGKILPILDVADLMESSIRLGAATTPSAAGEHAIESKRTILVAEDSITARTLLKNILESAGYTVKTAVDGMDALTNLRSGEFDLLVSDVDMPRMNGFDLTSRIRSDQRLGELPVVLVTALESREDRERGIDAGANAYIVKSGFDQTNLLEVVRRLI